MTLLVTGATGLVGNNVVRCLLARGHSVRVLTRERSDPRPLAGLDIERSMGDVRDAAAVRAALQGCSAIIHAAAVVRIGWTGLAESQDVHVAGTRHVVDAAHRLGARLVHVSTVDALGNGTPNERIDERTPFTPRLECPYVVTKRNAEVVVQQAIAQGLDAVIVHPSYMLGPWDWKPSSGRMLLEIARRKPPFAPQAVNDFTHVVDVAEAIVRALFEAPPGERYLLTGETLTYLEAFRIMAKICGVRGLRWTVGPAVLRPAGWFGDVIARLTGREGDINSAAIRLAQEPHYYSHAKATRELDYHPRNLQAAAIDAWQWFREQRYI